MILVLVETSYASNLVLPPKMFLLPWVLCVSILVLPQKAILEIIPVGSRESYDSNIVLLPSLYIYKTIYLPPTLGGAQAGEGGKGRGKEGLAIG